MACIILLSGWSGAGKDAVGGLMTKLWGFQRVAFADELKRIIAKEYDFPIEWTQTQDGKRQTIPSAGKTVRELMIQRGQEIRKEQNDPEFFARHIGLQIIERIKSNPTSKIVCTDWRLPIEFTALEKMLLPFNCKLLKVCVRNLLQTESPVQDITTEYQLQKYVFDAILYNDGVSLTTLQAELEKKLYDHIFLHD
jgi:hypothetical protein